MKTQEYKLTQYSHGAGCGCKIAPAVLDEILNASGTGSMPPDVRLLVGNAQNDDAAVFDLDDGTAVISTTDFFMPIVDDPVDFGRIAAVNAMSDVYAMGGIPVMAIAILGWPVDKIPVHVAGEVLCGAHLACREAGIPLAGGHSIDSPEPIFGLAVTGRVDIENIKRNSGGRPGDLLYLTKPLGVGILSTAQKKGLLHPEHVSIAPKSMASFNDIGFVLGGQDYVHAMTDVTGFGLGGHLLEMCRASNLHAQIVFDALPLLDVQAISEYVDRGCVPGGTKRNFRSYGDALNAMDDFRKAVVCDPQTSGGLLIAVDPASGQEFEDILKEHGVLCAQIGKLRSPVGTYTIEVV